MAGSGRQSSQITKDATAGSSPEASQAALDKIEYFQTGSIITAKETIAAIEAYSREPALAPVS